VPLGAPLDPHAHVALAHPAATGARH
jgi:hypothetical protein